MPSAKSPECVKWPKKCKAKICAFQTINWELYIRIGSTSGSLMCISFHVLENNDPNMEKCYRYKEWILLFTTSKNFWEITTARTSKKQKLKRFQDWYFPAYFDKLLLFLTSATSNWRDTEKKIIVIWCTYIQLQARMYS